MRRLSLGLTILLATTTLIAHSTPVDNKEGLWFFGGIGGGYQMVSSSASVTSRSGTTTTIAEVGKSGFGIGLRPALSMYFNSMVFDLGLGYSYSRFSYSNFDPDPTASGSANNASKTNNTMTIKNAILELNPRFRMGDEFQLGPLFQVHFGGDAGHSELDTETRKWLPYLGAQLNYEFPVGEATLMRLGVQGLTSLMESKRRNIMINGIWEVGFALFGDSKPSYQPQEEPPEPIQKIEDFTFEEFDDNIPSARETAPQQITVRLPSDKFLFDTAMSHISNKRTRQYLRDYGAILAANLDKWDSMEVVGHTDNRGTRRVNQELSTARARTVQMHLGEGGIPSNRMNYVGRAFDEPADRRNNKQAWARNRRVELVIRGVRATPEMLDEVERLNNRYGYANGGRR